MRTVQRNKRELWYSLYNGETELTDSNGDYTGETEITYSAPVMIRANVSPATGQSSIEMFGNFTDYDRVLVTDDVDIPINENSVVFLESSPVITGNKISNYDYEVRRVARSFNSVSIAIKQVSDEDTSFVIMSPSDYDGVLTPYGATEMWFGAGVG